MLEVLSKLLSIEEEEDNEAKDFFLMALGLAARNKQRQHRFWVHSILQKRKIHGACHHLVKELQLEAERFHEYFRSQENT